MPPLVLAAECALLRRRTAAVARGEAILLYGGSRVASPYPVDEDSIRQRLRTLTQMQLILAYATALPVVKLGWTVGPPGAYQASAAALNLVRALTAGPAQDLRQIPLGTAGADVAIRHREQLAGIARGIGFLTGHGLERVAATVEIFAGHECPHLDQAHVTPVTLVPDVAYSTGGHLLWLNGELRDPARDDLQQAQIAALSLIHNAIAVRIGPGTSADAVLRVVDQLDPHREPGRLTFVVRLGPARLRDLLSLLVE
jgi:3-deoxy-7-phosphoheptulonate synthase